MGGPLTKLDMILSPTTSSELISSQIQWRGCGEARWSVW